MQFNFPVKKPAEILDYKLDWIDALDGDQIAASTWVVATANSAVTIESSNHTSTATVVWLSGGNVGTWTLKNTVQTTGGRTYQVFPKLPVRA